MKIVYHFDENGAYCGASEACRSPLEDDVYLIPAMATDVMPPATGKTSAGLGKRKMDSQTRFSWKSLLA